MNDTAVEEKPVSVAEIAALLGKSRGWVYRHARTEDIPGFKVGGEWRFFPSKVIAHFNQPTDPWVLPTRSRKRVA